MSQVNRSDIVKQCDVAEPQVGQVWLYIGWFYKVTHLVCAGSSIAEVRYMAFNKNGDFLVDELQTPIDKWIATMGCAKLACPAGADTVVEEITRAK